MKLDVQDRPVPAVQSDSHPVWFAALVIVVTGVAALAAFPDVRDYAKGLAFAVGDAVGVRLPGAEYSAVYKRMGLAPLPARLLPSSQISSGLERIARAPCDNTAVF